MTSGERATLSALAGIACLMLAGYAADVVGLPFMPVVLCACGAGGAIVWWRVLPGRTVRPSISETADPTASPEGRRGTADPASDRVAASETADPDANRKGDRPSAESTHSDAAELVALIVVVIAFGAYTLWLAWPSLLPVSQGPDMVHHVSLIQFIQDRRALVGSRVFDPYLGEMVRYTPGTHILAAAVASVCGSTAIRVLHPILTVIVAVKAGTLLLILLRVLPVSRARVWLGLAGAALLLVPHEYTFRSFTFSYFYSQVIAEAFTVAMFWVLVAWHQQPSRRLLALFALFAIAVFYSWPVFVGVPLVALAGLLLGRALHGAASSSGRARFRQAIADLAIAAAPVAIFAAAYSVPRLSAAGILRANGEAVVPDVHIAGWPLIALAVAGLSVSFRRRWLLPLLVFFAAAVLQTLALYEYDSRHGIQTFYAARKMFHVLVYPGIVAAVVGIVAIADGLATRLPLRIAPTSGIILLAILVVAAFAGGPDLLLTRPRTAITEPVLEAGLWAKGHLPSDCVEYLTDHWLTAYWLHVDVLGNPRRMARTNVIIGVFDYGGSIERWKGAEGLPYAIVSDWTTLPPHAQEAARVLQRFGPAAVVERLGGGVCTERAVPIERFAR